MSSPTLELWQTEWCPASHRVRQRLTELGLTYTVHQVPVQRDARTDLEAATGLRSIPVLLASGQVIDGEQAILAYLKEHFTDPPQAQQQRDKAARAKQGTGGSMPQVGSSYTLSRVTELSFADAVTRVREELAREGFGILCEIDVQATLEAKLGVKREPYLILGACNPPLAHRALEAEPELGTLLPCNVIVYQEQGRTHIAAIDAEEMLSIVGNDDLADTAGEVRRRLAAVVSRSSEAEDHPARQ